MKTPYDEYRDNGQPAYLRAASGLSYETSSSESPRSMAHETTLKPESVWPSPIPFSGLVTNRILGALKGEDFAALLPHLEPVFFTAGKDVYKFGSGIDYVYFPETAVFSQVIFLEDGSSNCVTLIGNEGMVGLFGVLDSRQPAYWNQVAVGGSAVRARTAVIRNEFMNSESMQKLLLSYTSARLAQLSRLAVCNGRHSLLQRLCTWLLMIHDRTSEKVIPLTHENISTYLGARRAGITGFCNALKDSGIIHYRRGKIQILDRQKLEEAACECYGAMKEY